MTEPLSSAEIAEAKALCEELPEPCLVMELVHFADKCRTLVPRFIATIEAKDAKDAELAAAVKERDELGGSESNWREYAEKLERDLEAERTARQEAERMLAEVEKG